MKFTIPEKLRKPLLVFGTAAWIGSVVFLPNLVEEKTAEDMKGLPHTAYLHQKKELAHFYQLQRELPNLEKAIADGQITREEIHGPDSIDNIYSRKQLSLFNLVMPHTPSKPVGEEDIHFNTLKELVYDALTAVDQTNRTYASLERQKENLVTTYQTLGLFSEESLLDFETAYDTLLSQLNTTGIISTDFGLGKKIDDEIKNYRSFYNGLIESGFEQKALDEMAGGYNFGNKLAAIVAPTLLFGIGAFLYGLRKDSESNGDSTAELQTTTA